MKRHCRGWVITTHNPHRKKGITLSNQSVRVTLNDETVDLPAEATVADAVTHTTGRELGPDGRPTDGRRLGVAVAVDGTVVPRSAWADTAVDDGQTLEIVTAVQGG